MVSRGNGPILVERQGSIGWIALNRPHAINAINDAVREGLPAALHAFDADPVVHVIVLHGTGPRGFCAGADLKEVRPDDRAATVHTPRDHSAWIESFDSIGTPVIAAIHGYCLGGGLEIALACDLRIAAPDAQFGLPETGLGLIPGGGGTQRLPRVVGLGRTLDLLLTGDRIDADQALRWGLVSRLASTSATLISEAGELAARIAARPPTAQRFAKEAARAAIGLDLHTGLRLEQDLFTSLLSTDERRQAAAAFRVGRPSQGGGS